MRRKLAVVMVVSFLIAIAFLLYVLEEGSIDDTSAPPSPAAAKAEPRVIECGKSAAPVEVTLWIKPGQEIQVTNQRCRFEYQVLGHVPALKFVRDEGRTVHRSKRYKVDGTAVRSRDCGKRTLAFRTSGQGREQTKMRFKWGPRLPPCPS